MSSSLQPYDWSPPGSSVSGILQARILEWVAISSSRGSSRPRDWAQVSCVAGRLYCLSHLGSFVVKAVVFPVVMYRCELDHKKGWVPKSWCFQTTVLEKTLESPLGSKDAKLVDPKGNQPWIFIGKTDAEAEAPILWPPDAKSQLAGKDLDAGKDWGQKEKRATEDEMVRWHHQLNGHEFDPTQGDSEGQGSLACCSPWGHKE